MHDQRQTWPVTAFKAAFHIRAQLDTRTMIGVRRSRRINVQIGWCPRNNNGFGRIVHEAT